jgi:uncharacterized iron-regulated membrane protein
MRRLLFQVHLWVGIALGLYIFIISVSGSLIVFRRELDRAICPGPTEMSPSGPIVTAACEPEFVTVMAEFHDHLGGGRTGLFINGLGAMAVVVMCVTGAVIWWPGRRRWRRSLTLHRGVGARRFIRDLHNVLGIYLLLLIFMWALTGVYFAFPDPFLALSDQLAAGSIATPASRLLDASIEWLVRLHFGRSFGLTIEVLWVILGLVPGGLFITGALMWWTRVLRPALYRAAARGDGASTGSRTTPAAAE